MSNTSKVWLVTGSAAGLGRDIAEAVLAAGHRLVATARQPERLADLHARYGDQVRTLALDVTDAAAARAAVALAVEAFGRLDVVVNNAGYADVAPFEQMDLEVFRAQIDTNLMGVANVTHAALPVMRAQRSGHILQVSSVGGRLGRPGLSAYQAAKWAVGGLTEVLAGEVNPLGIQICALEPGGMRTGWGTRSLRDTPAVMPDYQASVGALVEMFKPYIGNEAGDPAKIAQLILRLADHPTLPPHLLLGSDALHYFGLADGERAAQLAAWEAVSRSTDVAYDRPVPALPETAPQAVLTPPTRS
ncbi:SDR family NAD(P)-dependent oxidoreductase [Nitrospirillum viridazoti]|uniref:Short-chain dehydrogenase/reductase n=1 Tax=Nitrospirillum viridazoti CBAmc TaxID=1441467 RepID=A0A248JSG9_9PROT|nr:SDR family NAD(P)-dependent oxidoreductase [Nitrospirillum amazonense]ASG21431.1 short-chain dehydrogenase/reductase [Nitrospirillum amazonense CBAmc]TWB29349.1 NADP-dependent 3-hydroxy acid dehydrogenase YdfG [Nitrospirillum amazonense]